jgi:hypothetical protein
MLDVERWAFASEFRCNLLIFLRFNAATPCSSLDARREPAHYLCDSMAADVKKEIELEIAHILFLDIVGYSKLSANEQHARVQELNEIVRLSEQFRLADAEGKLLLGARSA